MTTLNAMGAVRRWLVEPLPHRILRGSNEREQARGERALVSRTRRRHRAEYGRANCPDLRDSAEMIDGHAQRDRGARANDCGVGWVRRPDEARPAWDGILRRDRFRLPLERTGFALRKQTGNLPLLTAAERQLLRGVNRCAGGNDRDPQEQRARERAGLQSIDSSSACPRAAASSRGRIALDTPRRGSVPAPYGCRVNCTVAVMITGTGDPFSNVGVNSHCFTASRAA